MQFQISNEEIRDSVGAPEVEFPKYTTQILNLANQNAQGTRPVVVGQMSDLIQECPGRTLEEWERWYRKRHPQAVHGATDKVLAMVALLKQAMERIDRNLVEKWVHDLVIVKTFTGLRFQEAILRRMAESLDQTYRLATPLEESRGIDGFIGNKEISIKPHTYKSKSTLPETLNATIAYYEKTKTGLRVECEGF